MILGLAAGNWEIWIAEYNLQAGFPRLDIGFLLNMPPRVLPVLAARQAIIDQMPHLVAEGSDGYYYTMEKAQAHELLRQKVAEFRQAYPKQDWQSRTGAGELTYKQLTNHE